jgi:hypothetical protein
VQHLGSKVQHLEPKVQHLESKVQHLESKCNTWNQKCNIVDQKCNILNQSAAPWTKSATSWIKSATSRSMRRLNIDLQSMLHIFSAGELERNWGMAGPIGLNRTSFHTCLQKNLDFFDHRVSVRNFRSRW